MSIVLSIDKLNYCIGDRIIFDVSDLHVKEGEIIHMTGNSGVGKSLFGLSLIGFYSNQAHVDIDLEIGHDDEMDWRAIREKEIGYIFQQPKAYFNPSLTCGQQLLELLPEGDSIENKKRLIREYCNKLKLDIQERIFTAYPHEFSIGQLQRIYVISTLIRKPKMIIADEPFAHLDWPTAQLVASELEHYVSDHKAALLLISHEQPGSLLTPHQLWSFENQTIRTQAFHNKNINATQKINVAKPSPILEPIIRAKQIGKIFDRNVFSTGNRPKEILKNINLSISKGGRIGLMGGSGSGKSTLANILSGLISPTSGEVLGVHQVEYSLSSLFNRKASPVQIVFQDPYSSFNPTQKIKQQISNEKNINRVIGLAEKLVLSLSDMNRTPMELSGGELQRFAIVRALSVDPKPKMLILDEALSAIDLSTQAKVLTLLDADFPDLAILFISHRFDRLASLCSEVFFLHEGEFVYHLSDLSVDRNELPEHVRRLIK